MEKNITDILKVFIEKHFIPSVISIVLTFLIYLIAPTDFIFLDKFGTIGFLVFSFCSCILIVEFTVFIWIRIKKYREERHNKTYYDKKVKDENEKLLDQLWTRVDNMSKNEYEILLEFIKNGNKPYLSASIWSGDSLLNSNWVHKTEFHGEEKVPIKIDRPVREGVISIPIYETISARYQYILNEHIYQILKHSMDKYGKISHFNT